MIDLNDDNASVYVDNPTMRGDFLPNRVVPTTHKRRRFAQFIGLQSLDTAKQGVNHI